jgi:DNA-binding NtrC family response regulator
VGYRTDSRGRAAHDIREHAKELNASLTTELLPDRMSVYGTRDASTPAESRVQVSAIVLLITLDRDLMKRLGRSSPGFAKDALRILCVGNLSDATQRLSLNDSIDAAILDWELADTRGLEALLALMGAAPHLPIIVLGADPSLPRQMDLVEHGAQDYLLKRRADAAAVICMVYSAIARKSRERVTGRGHAPPPRYAP